MIDPLSRQDLVRSLLEAHSDADADADGVELTRKLMRIFLRIGSETPDNLNCVEHLEYGSVPGTPTNRRARYGFKIKGTDIAISDIAWAIEDMPMPPAIAQVFPELTGERWDAATRMITMLLSALERDDEPG